MPNIYELSDSVTGKIYRMEADDDVTEEEALSQFESLSEEEWAQFEYQVPETTQAATAPQPEAPVSVSAPQQEPKKATPWDNVTTNEVFTNSLRNIPEADDLAASLWREGVRDPEVFNQRFAEQFPELGAQIDKQTIAKARAYEAHQKAVGRDLQGYVFAPVTQETGIPDPEAPETVSESIGSSAVKSAQNMANSAVGLTGVFADVLGFDGTAEELLESYVENQAAIQYNRPDAVGTLDNLEWDNAAQYGAEAIGELLPQLASAGLAGIAGKAGGEIIAGRAVAKMVEDLTARGMAQEAAENLVTQTVTQKLARRGATVAVVSQSIGQETGTIYGNTYFETGERAPIASIGAGILSGSLDAVLPMRFLDNIGISGDVVRQSFGGAVGRIAVEGAKGFVIEGATEAVQEFIAQLPTSYVTGESPFTQELLNNMVNAFVKGGIGGGFVGSVSATRTGEYRGPRTEYLENRESTIVTPTGRKNSKAYKQGLEDARVRTEEIVNDSMSNWENRPNVTVLSNFKGTRFEDGALGVYAGDGQIALNTEAILQEAKDRKVSPDMVVESVLFHEALGHYGLESLYRENLDSKLYDFYTKGSPDFRDMVDKWINDNPGAYTDQDGNVDVVRATEEVLAEIAQEGNMPRSILDELINFIKDFMRNVGMDNFAALNYSEREIRTIVAKGQDKVRVGPQVDLVTGQAVDKYIYIGQKAKEGEKLRREISRQLEADTGVGYLSQNHLSELKRQYGQAKKLGNTEEELYQMFGPESITRTSDGWFIGKDGKWRMEISDLLSEIDLNPIYNSPDSIAPLGEVLDHTELFRAYPTLKLLEVSTRPEDAEGGNTLGYLDIQRELIYVDPSLSDYQFHSVLLHEVQHAVQYIESFGFGGTPDTAIDNLPKETLLKGSKNLVQHYKREAEDASHLWDVYDQVMELPEAQAFRQNYTILMELWNQGYGDDSIIFQEASEALNKASDAFDEVMIGDGDSLPSGLRKDYEKIRAAVAIPEQGNHLTRDAMVKTDLYEGMSKAIRIKDYVLMRYFAKQDKQSKYEAYQHMLGEYEARDVQARMDFDEVERRNIPPLTSEPELDSDALFAVDQYGEALSVREPETTSAGFRRRNPDSRSYRESRKQFWEMKQKSWDDGVEAGGNPKYMKPRGNYMDVGVTAQNDNVTPYSKDRKGKPLLPPRVMSHKEYAQYSQDMVNYYKNRAANHINVNQRIYEKSLKAARQWESIKKDSLEKAARYLNGTEESRSVRPVTRQMVIDTQYRIDPELVPSNDKYARPMKVNKKVEPLTVEELTADDLVNSMNALDILNGVVDNYQATSLPLDQLRNEAALRAIPPSVIQKLSVNPGEFTVKMFAYDIAAQKLNDKLATLYGKIQSGRYTAKDKAEFLKTSMAFEDITSKIFGLQSEYGRVLRALQDMEFTAKRIKTIRDALKGLDNDTTGLAGLDDPATFERYARTLVQQQEQTASENSEFGQQVLSIINTPRSIMSSYDLSAPLRQGVFFVGRPEYYKAWVTMMQSEADYQYMMKEIMKSDTYGLMSVGKLFMSSIDGDVRQREESFQSDLASKIPGVRWSEVKYASFLNKLRADLFNSFVEEYESKGYELRTKTDPKTGERVPKNIDELTEKETAILRALGSFINAGTGRGNLTLRQNKFLQAAGPVLNALFFSPGLIMSRMRLLNPVWYASLPKPVRQSALTSAGAFAMPLVTILGAAALFFGEETVEWDPRSSDFLKLKFGDTRYDITGGMASTMTLFSRAFIHSSNQLFDTDWASRKDSVGDLHKYNEGFKDGTFLDDFMRYNRYKTSPVASFVLDFWDGKNAIGEPFTVAGGIADRAAPLYLQDLFEIAEDKEAKDVPWAILAATPGFFGVGVSRYTPSPLDTEQVLEAPKEFKDQRYSDADNDFVSISEGVVTLKPPAERMWHKTVNAFFQEVMQEQVSHPLWPTLTPKEQSEIISEAKKIARDETKKYMYPLIGMGNDPEEEVE